MDRRRRRTTAPLPGGVIRRWADRGAVMVEFLVVAPVIVMLALGLLEFGYGFRSHTILTQAAADGLRVASSAGFDGLADFAALEAVAASSGSLPGDSTVLRVVIFDPESASWIDGTCRTMVIPATGHTGVAGACNVYEGSELATLNPANFVGGSASCNPGDWDSYLCPLDRDADPDGGGTMRLGIYVEVDHEMVSGLFPPGQLDLDETLEMCLEPAGPGVPAPTGNLGDLGGNCDGSFP